MKIQQNPQLRKRGMVGPVLALLILVIGAVIIWKIYKLAERLLPLPPPPPPCPTNNTPTNFPFTNASVDAAWFVLGYDNAPTNSDPMDVMYGVMPNASVNGLMNFTDAGIPVMAGAARESVGVFLDTSNVLGQIRAWYGVGPDQYNPNNAAHSAWAQDDAGNWTWTSTPATNLTYDPGTGTITVQEWARADAPRLVVLQRSEDWITWTNLWTNSLRAGQFHLYRDLASPTNKGFYRTEMRQ